MRLQRRRFSEATDVRRFPHGHIEVVELDDNVVGRMTYEPGWRWSRDIKPIAGGEACQFHHLGFTVSGRLRVQTSDGAELETGPDEVFEFPPGHDAWVVGDEPWTTLEWTSARIVGIGPETPGERVLATVLFTDIVDSTATLERVGDRVWRELLGAHNARLRDDLNTFRGREVKTTGDGFIAVFDGATRAVRCASAISRSAAEVGLPIRIGIHTGEVEFIGGDIRGVAVHAAARVMALAGPGEVFLSSTTSDLLEGSGIAVEDAGTPELKGLSGPRRVFRLVVPPQTV
jgi:class 3 adenylate cyclase